MVTKARIASAVEVYVCWNYFSAIDIADKVIFVFFIPLLSPQCSLRSASGMHARGLWGTYHSGLVEGLLDFVEPNLFGFWFRGLEWPKDWNDEKRKKKNNDD